MKKDMLVYASSFTYKLLDLLINLIQSKLIKLEYYSFVNVEYEKRESIFPVMHHTFAT